jgi:exodeoxyribonuclease VII large subunit
MSVTALLTRIKGALSQAFPGRLTVAGEISNLKLHSSGHLYFRLKDAGAAIDATMFRSAAAKLKFRPTDGMEVVVEGKVDVYDVRGQLQLYVESITPKGVGALELAFRQLCQKLQQAGLFEPSHKIPIRRIPRAIGLVTSPTGAAIRDIRRTLARRWPAADVYLVPALVQGEGAAASIAEAIALLDANADKLSLDTIIIARGGGSMEDLWAFNEEIVARAIYSARTAIICGVGHEADVTIADLAADLRAATPTAAAELAVPDREDVGRGLTSLASQLTHRVSQQVAQGKSALASVMRSVVFRDPSWRLRTLQQRFDELGLRLRGALRHLFARGRQRLEPASNRLAAQHPARIQERAAARLQRLTSQLAWVLGGRSKRSGDTLAVLQQRLQAGNPRNHLELARQMLTSAQRQLEVMSYRSILGRGFSVTRSRDGKILRSVADAAGSEILETELIDGKIKSFTDSATRPSAKRTKKDASQADNQQTLF